MARFTVTNNNDSGAGSLRQAIIDAGNVVGVDTIDLTSVSGTINLNSSLGNLNTGNDINFVDDGNTTISGQNAYQILAVNGASVTFSRLSFVNGLARGGDGNNGGGGGLGAGGALFINAGNVTLNNVTFSGNRAVGGNANGNAGSGGGTGSNGSGGGSGGGFNSTTSGGSGGGAGIYDYDTGRPGGNGGSGSFGAGGGGGGGGGGAYEGGFWYDPSDGGGNGGNGGNAGFGGGGGGGGGGGYDYDYWSSNDYGSGGAEGAGGQFGGNGNGGAGGDNRSGSRGGGGAGLGGAIFVNSGASLTLLNSVFTGNSATGGTGANNGQGVAANIFVNGATAQAIGTNYSDTYGTINAVSFLTNAYEYNGSIYRLTTAGTWQQAQLQAQSLGGNLVTVNNQAEQDWLVTTFGPTERLWIGLTDEETAGQYKWASGETSTYRNWATNEPSDSAGHVQDYVYINYLSPGRWDDLGTGQLRGIIENKFYEYNGSKYLLTGPGTWKQAQDQARSLGGNLVTVNNQAEQDWLVSTFGGSELLWIGLTDEVTEGQFRWASGETYTYTNTNWNWNTGEPNNLRNEDYAGMNWGGAGKWNDYPSTWSQRGIIEINQYGAVGGNPQSQFFSLAKPEKFTISVIGGFGPDIFQLRSYDGLTTSQQVSGGQGGDIFNISLEGSSGIVGLDFNAGKLKDLATTIVTPNWDIKNERRIANMAHASIQAGIDIASGVTQGINITGIGNGFISAAAAAAKGANTIANIAANYFLDIKETNAKLNQLGNFFDGQGANGWGTVNITQSRSLVEILDFEPGIDTITLPKLTGNQNYTFTLAAGNQNAVLVALYNGTNASIPFLKINIASTLQGLVNGQNIGLAQFIQSLLVNNSANSVIGKTLNDSSKVAVSGASYTGTMAGDYIYVAQNNPTVGSVKIYGNAGDDILAGGGNNGSNEIYGGDGDDFIVPGGVNDTIDGGAGYDQVNYSQNAVGISITSSNSTNFKTVESVTGTVYNDTINYSDLQVAPDDGLPINLEGRAGNDSLVGSQYRDVIDGEDGNDTLIGGAGSDILKGGAGDDILNPGYSQYSTDTVDGGDGNDLLQVNYSNKTSASVGIHLGFQNNNVIYHRAGTNGDNYELVKFSNIERFDITGTQYDDVFEGRSGNDTFNGGAGNDILNGGAGDDILNPGYSQYSTDTVDGGDGNDLLQVDYTSKTDNAGIHLGYQNTNHIWNRVNGQILVNVSNVENYNITGTQYDDVFEGRSGTDTFNGGAGDDIYIVDSTTDTITENANEGIDTIQSSVTLTLATNVENLTLTGTAAINGTGNAGNNVITGNAGNNTLDGGAGNDTLNGGSRDSLLSLDGVNDYVNLNNPSHLNFTGEITIEAWVKVKATDGLRNIVAHGHTNNPNGEVYLRVYNGQYQIASWNGRDYMATFAIPSADIGNWVHLAGVYNSQAQAWQLYRNGILVNSTAASVGALLVNENWAIGARGNGTERFFNGDIDEVRIWNKARTQQEIQANLNQTLAGNEANLAGYWNFDNVSGSTITDLAKGNNGTLTNGASIIVASDILIGGTGDDIYIVDTTTDTITENVNEGIDTIQSSVTLTLATNVENLTITGTAAINGTGNELNNVITGNSANNILDGGAGTDTLIGGTGDDIYIVDTTTDTITENVNEGTDTIQSSVTFTLATNVENLTLTGTAVINGTGNELNNVITGNAANNILDGGAGIDTLIGGLGDDIYIVDTTTDTITENVNEGIDTIQSSVTLTLATNVENLTITGTAAINGTGNELNNVITGNSANNILDGGAGTDTLIGGTGDDIYIVDTTTDTITENVNEGTDTIQSSVTLTLATNVENLTLTGTAVINGTGNELNNVITGNAANNILDGGAGTDTLIGGTGDDIYIVDTTTDTITENANEGTDTIQSSVTLTLATNVENLTLTGTAAINGTGNAGNNVITGNGANNTLDGGAGTDTLIGGLGNDIYVVDSTTDTITENASGGTDTIQSSVTYTIATLALANVENLTLTGTAAINGTGNAGNNVITGNAGNNTLNGGAGTDTLIGGLGNDIYVVDSTTDIITELANGGTDTIQSSATLTLATNVENLTLTGTAAINGTGNAGNNVITGNSANNILDGGAGTDTLIGGLGNDIYVVDSATDTITENASGGTDTIQSSVTYTIATLALANVENLTLTGTAAINGTGNAANNVITGNTANNTLNGGAGNDTLNGGAGNDTLTGGVGKDTLIGELGVDRFDYRVLTDSVFSNFDIITGLNASVGNDLFLVTTARSGFNNVTTPVTTLDATGIAARLTPAVFTVNSAAQFTFGTRTFVAINDATAGFSATTDAIIEVTGLTGTLGISNFITTLV
ncbi:hypothetical protein H6F39_00795 [Anabaena sp. FACHB-1250]|uniref:LamG-like jellyroll fold domain-containing protein n=1 Tax=Anabaena sp. FACHB-1250 TaxID=2692770 RepID=UPI00168010F9|nr:LamG-like jellyroll fold domain-containing protein [Anabaena sp. FACHB-1250]MBD2139957.1 hypothetical protein [Anabaena sp. FACHB-1250]